MAYKVSGGALFMSQPLTASFSTDNDSKENDE